MHLDFLRNNFYISIFTSVVVLMILFLNNPELAFSPKTPLEIIEAVSVNNTILSSLTVDPISNHLYVSGVPDYSYNAAPVLCLKYNTNSSNMPCSVIYVLMGGHDQINNIIRLTTWTDNS